MPWLIGCWNTAKPFGIRKSLLTLAPGSWTRSLRKPKPPIAQERQRPFREIKRVAGFLEAFQSAAAKRPKDCAQEFHSLEKTTKPEVSRLQKNEAQTNWQKAEQLEPSFRAAEQTNHRKPLIQNHLPAIE